MLLVTTILESTVLKDKIGGHLYNSMDILFIYLLFIFGCVGSLLLRAVFLYLRQAGATLLCSARASHCGGFSCSRAQALGEWTQ